VLCVCWHRRLIVLDQLSPDDAHTTGPTRGGSLTQHLTQCLHCTRTYIYTTGCILLFPSRVLLSIELNSHTERDYYSLFSAVKRVLEDLFLVVSVPELNICGFRANSLLFILLGLTCWRTMWYRKFYHLLVIALKKHALLLSILISSIILHWCRIASN
jgi:hypothetical protein